MLGNSFYYFSTGRKLTAAFGSIFNDVYITRYSENGIAGIPSTPFKVPLSYAGSDKQLAQNQQKVIPQSDIRIKMSVPRISFECKGLFPDPSRKLVSTGYVQGYNALDADAFLKQLNPVPYDFFYQVNLIAKNIEDGMQMLEQILPSFTPSFNLSVNDIPELSIIRDVPVILTSVSVDDNYEGNFEDTRVWSATLNFTCKAYLYPVIKDGAIIKRIISTIYPDEAMLEEPTATITVEVDPITADAEDVYDISTTIEEIV